MNITFKKAQFLIKEGFVYDEKTGIYSKTYHIGLLEYGVIRVGSYKGKYDTYILNTALLKCNANKNFDYVDLEHCYHYVKYITETLNEIEVKGNDYEG